MIRVVSDYQEKGHEDRPYVLARAEKVVDGKILGYLKVAWVDPVLAHSLYPTPWHYMAGEAGWCVNMDDLKKRWRGCHHYAGIRPASHPESSHLNLSGLEPSVEQMTRDLVLLSHLPLRQNKSVCQLFADWLCHRGMHVYVDYARVASSLRRQGVATAMYQAMAAWLALTKGQVLFASSIQSSEAKGLWDSFRAGALPTFDGICGETGKPLWYLSYKYSREDAKKILKQVEVLPGNPEFAYDEGR